MLLQFPMNDMLMNYQFSTFSILICTGNSFHINSSTSSIHSCFTYFHIFNSYIFFLLNFLLLLRMVSVFVRIQFNFMYECTYYHFLTTNYCSFWDKRGRWESEVIQETKDQMENLVYR